MTSINFPDLIAEKISWYHWKDQIQAVNRQIPSGGIPPSTDVDLVLSQVDNVTRRQAFTKLIQYKGDIVDAIMDLTPFSSPPRRTIFLDDPRTNDQRIIYATPFYAQFVRMRF